MFISVAIGYPFKIGNSAAILIRILVSGFSSRRAGLSGLWITPPHSACFPGSLLYPAELFFAMIEQFSGFFDRPWKLVEFDGVFFQPIDDLLKPCSRFSQG